MTGGGVMTGGDVMTGGGKAFAPSTKLNDDIPCPGKITLTSSHPVPVTDPGTETELLSP